MNHSYLSPTGVEIAFVLIGLITVGSALLVVTVQNLMHAALWLVVSLGSIAGEYLLLGAELVAWVQILIYVGAVVVLILFGLVLTKAPIGPTTELDVKHKLPAALVAAGATGVLVTVLVDAYHNVWIDSHAAIAQGTAAANGAALFKYWVLPFETLSVLLLAALVGAIVISRRGRAEGASEWSTALESGPVLEPIAPSAALVASTTANQGAEADD
ncbi:MAG TPA: NADH-quinone oxidoreductase subunit J [Actinocrinis sp.]|uniref:NADH-quinone oxidoreductase subunit J family protein n=1 Tax=Actinocrinis sp. TaxID=1920516 RepID=UPI002DDDA3B6|nr:NADH-quinone oxidoreductase subunit J [Actinocrinis sp.]HEV3170803.1 NADH-quinone oxidoreductase subunit J [Actinocrinis sp.]